jgi:DNA-binding MarR family transcriptional regulator
MVLKGLEIMSEQGESLANELVDQLQRIPHLLRRVHHGTKRRLFKDGGSGAEHHASRDESECRAHHRGNEHHGHGGCGEGGWHRFVSRRHHGGRGQSGLLKLLLECDGILVKDIVETLDIRPSSASELVAKLEKRGLVRTETDAHDKRAKRVYTTEKTREYFDRAKTAHSEVAGEVLAALSHEEQEQLLALLKKIAASFEDRPQGGVHNN